MVRSFTFITIIMKDHVKIFNREVVRETNHCFLVFSLSFTTHRHTCKHTDTFFHLVAEPLRITCVFGYWDFPICLIGSFGHRSLSQWLMSKSDLCNFQIILKFNSNYNSVYNIILLDNYWI